MKKFIILLCLIILLVVTIPYGCHLSDQILAKKMIEKYSEDQNYVTLSGEVMGYSEFDEEAVMIKCVEMPEYTCDYHIYSDQIIELSVGDQIDFVTVPFHFYNGHELPIVELKKDGNTLLTFEEGKENLIEWVNKTFN